MKLIHLRTIAGRLGIAGLLLLILISGIGSCAYAETEPGQHAQHPVSVNIPVKHRIRGGTYRGDDAFLFTLTAENENCPMPEGSDGLCKTVAAGSDGMVDFGSIIFERPDACCYTVTREPVEHRRISEDRSSYKVTAAALANGESEIIVQKVSGDGNKAGAKIGEIIYEDVYDAPPKTGDDNTGLAMLISASGILSLACLILIIVLRRKEDADEWAD